MLRTPLLPRQPHLGSEIPRHRTPSRQPRGKRLLVAGASVLGLALSASVAPPAEASYPVLIGASGEYNDLVSHVGVPLSHHYYGQLDGSVPDGRLVNMKPNVGWATVANAQPGSAVYSDIIRWADTLNARPTTVLFTFSHEPESSASDWLGTSTQFVAAFRRVETIFRSRGVDNVEYTWNMTANAFRVPATDERSAAKWYPGDSYVDNVATAAYNWYGCGPGSTDWLSLANRASAPLAYAKAHGKPYLIAEFGSQTDPRRAQWLRDAYAWIKANRADIRGAFYYNTSDHRPGCYWQLTTAEEFSAFRAMASDPVFGT